MDMCSFEQIPHGLEPLHSSFKSKLIFVHVNFNLYIFVYIHVACLNVVFWDAFLCLKYFYTLHQCIFSGVSKKENNARAK
jgi:hypothetical protein